MSLAEGLGRTLGLRTAAFRVVTTAVALFSLIAALIVAVLFWQTNEALTGEVVETVRVEAATLAAIGRTGGEDALQHAVEARVTGSAPGLYWFAGADGRWRAGNLMSPPAILSSAGFPVEGGSGVFHYDAPGAGARLAVAVVQALPDGGRLLVGRDIEASRAFARRLGLQLFFGFLTLSLAGLGFAVLVSRIVMGRIGRMTAASRAIMAGNLSERIPTDGSKDELDDLAGSLNAMLERIESLMTGMREVSDNIAHDLKTPLNRLRQRAEAGLRDGEGRDGTGGGQKKALERVIEDADDLIKTFNALLLVAKLEAGAVEDNAEVFDLGALVRDLADLFEPAAEEAGQRLSVVAPGASNVRANRQLIGQALANLIENAMKYGRREGIDAGSGSGSGPGAITIAVARSARGVEISVADRGPGIRVEDRARALKRFVRLDSARTRSGTGLGLSLVAAVARLHGGTVRLEDNRPGLRVVMALPARVVVD